MIHRRAAAGLIGAFAASAALPRLARAQASAWDAVVDAAKREGQLLIYNGTNFPVVKRIGEHVQKI